MHLSKKKKTLNTKILESFLWNIPTIRSQKKPHIQIGFYIFGRHCLWILFSEQRNISLKGRVGNIGTKEMLHTKQFFASHKLLPLHSLPMKVTSTVYLPKPDSSRNYSINKIHEIGHIEEKGMHMSKNVREH